MKRFSQWLTQKWSRQTDDKIAQAYQVTFSTPFGQLVLQHLLDTIYCQTCESMDPIALANENGRRFVVQTILEYIDAAENPQKHQVNVEQEIIELEERLKVKTA